MTGCPCCDGLTTGDHFDLCDTCLEGALAGRYPHGCDRPTDHTDGGL